ICAVTAAKAMNLAILTSRKGTRVIKATALHRELGLADHHYAQNVRKWLKDIYQFRDGIRTPKGMTDYARAGRKQENISVDYYLSLELAKLITLASKSKYKQALANKLQREEEVYPQEVQLSADATLELMEQVKAMSRFSIQAAAEARHKSRYHRLHPDQSFWNQYRADFVGYKKADLLLRLRGDGKKASSSRSFRELVHAYDSLELIRIGIIDHYAAQGHSLAYAAQMGKLAKRMAVEMRLEVFDDLVAESNLFAAPVDQQILAKMQRSAAA
ncbi:MAG: hypothetical protein AAFY36_16695, partial [Bacteroidota bacterium]